MYLFIFLFIKDVAFLYVSVDKGVDGSGHPHVEGDVVPEGDDGNHQEERGRTEERHQHTQPRIGEERLERGASQIEGSYRGVDDEHDQDVEPVDEVLALLQHDIGIDTAG